jgi:hypothetical protein
MLENVETPPFSLVKKINKICGNNLTKEQFKLILRNSKKRGFKEKIRFKNFLKITFKKF